MNQLKRDRISKALEFHLNVALAVKSVNVMDYINPSVNRLVHRIVLCLIPKALLRYSLSILYIYACNSYLFSILYSALCDVILYYPACMSMRGKSR